MAKLTLADIANLENETTVISTINANSALIEAALEKTLTRDDNTENPNAMSVDLQMGGKKITSLGTPSAGSDAATKAYVDASTGNDIGDITTAVAEAQAAAAAAEASATLAEGFAEGLSATSSTSLEIATGEKIFTIEAGKSFTEGQFVIAVDDADIDNYMFGQVVSYTGTTLTIEVDVIGGSGTIADWLINISGPRGADGAAGAGSGDVTASANFAASGRLIVSAGTDKTIDDTTVSVSGGAISSVSTLGISGTITSTSTAPLTATGSSATIELGAVGSTNTPAIDFHSSASSTGYDARISSSGGTSSDGAGTLTLTAATTAVSGALTAGGNVVLDVTGGDNLTGGFTTTAYNIGTLNAASSAYTVNPTNGYIQFYNNAGAHELDEPALPGVVIVQVTNVTGAGNITMDFDKVTGDTFSNTVGRVYELTIRKLPNYSVCNVLRIDV